MFIGIFFKLLTQVGARKESFAFKHAVNLGINVTGKSDKTQPTTFELPLVGFIFVIRRASLLLKNAKVKFCNYVVFDITNSCAFCRF